MRSIQHASTFEIDDPEAAVAEILDQIETESLASATVGIVSCNPSYTANHTIERLSASLPFPIIGNTTTISDICGEADEEQLSLLVISTDNARFALGVSAPLDANAHASITDLYEQVAEDLGEEPEFGLFFAPFLYDVSGGLQLKALDEASGSIPLFGTVALDSELSVREPRTILDGGVFRDRLVLLLGAGDVVPQYFVESISEERFMKQKAIVTASEDNLLKEVNGMPAAQYLESLGLVTEGEMESISVVPLSIDVGDGGKPVARAVFAATPDGCVVCGGDMPEGATLGVGSIDADDVQSTAKKLAAKIVEAENNNAAIIFSCVGRNRALGLDPMHEIEQIRSVLGDSIPYIFMYSSGELYPEIVDGKVLNKALNDSIIACVV